MLINGNNNKIGVIYMKKVKKLRKSDSLTSNGNFICDVCSVVA